MDLLSLAPELLDGIFHEVVRCIGVKGTARIRIVNRTFDSLAQNAIFSLPSFDRQGPWELGPLQPHPRMPPAMMQRFILTKLGRADALQRPLAREILQTARRLAQSGAPQAFVGRQRVCELAHLAAETLPVREVVFRLALSTEEAPGSDMALNELVCSVALSGCLPETYFELATRKDTRTMSFGDLISAAVRSGETILRNILQTLPKPATNLDLQIRSFRLGAALNLAVELGKVESVRILLGHNAGAVGWQAKYDLIAMVRAFELGDLPCARLLYQQHDPTSNPKASEACDTALRRAARNGHERLVHLLAEDRLSARGTNQHRGAVLEDACCGRSRSTVYAVLKHFAIALTPESNTLYWAGRNGDLEILDIVLRSFVKLKEDHLACLLDALAGASFASLEVVNAVLGHVGCHIDTIDAADIGPIAFSAAVNLVMAKYLEHHSERGATASYNLAEAARNGTKQYRDRRAARFPRLLAQLPEQYKRLAIECQQEQVLAIFRCLAVLPKTGYNDPVDATLGQLAEIAIMQNRPGLFMLLREHVDFHATMSDMVFAATAQKSTAMFQVLLDVGWDVNGTKIDYRDHPLFRLVIGHDTDLIRWLLEKGANPNLFDGHAWKETAMNTAARQFSTLKLLVAYGGDMRQSTLLLSAVQHQWGTFPLESLDWALGHGIPVDVRVTKSEVSQRSSRYFEATPLIFAASRGLVDACELLLRHGADSRLRNGEGKTPLELAEQQLYQDVVDLLRRWGSQKSAGF